MLMYGWPGKLNSLTSLDVSIITVDLVEEMAEDETRAYDDNPPTILYQTYIIPVMRDSMTSADASIDDENRPADQLLPEITFNISNWDIERPWVIRDE